MSVVPDPVTLFFTHGFLDKITSKEIQFRKYEPGSKNKVGSKVVFERQMFRSFLEEVSVTIPLQLNWENTSLSDGELRELARSINGLTFIIPPRYKDYDDDDGLIGRLSATYAHKRCLWSIHLEDELGENSMIFQNDYNSLCEMIKWLI